MYLGIIKSFWKEAIAYRTQTYMNLITTPLKFMVLIFIWSAVYASSGSPIQGYTLNDMVTYFIISTFVFKIVYDEVAHWLEHHIKTGNFMTYLLKPMSYITLGWLEKIAYRLFGLITELAALLAIFLIFFSNYLVVGHLAPFLISILLAFAIHYLVYLIIGTFAFWFINIRSFAWMMGFLIQLSAGVFFPIDLLPLWMQTTLDWLPFKYIIYIPTSLYLGRYDGMSELLIILGIQCLWIVILSLITYAFWKRGIKRFGGVGA